MIIGSKQVFFLPKTLFCKFSFAQSDNYTNLTDYAQPWYRSLRASSRLLLGMLDSATSFFSSARAHPWLEALICEPDEISQYKRPPVGSLLYCGAFNRNRTDLILTMDANRGRIVFACLRLIPGSPVLTNLRSLRASSRLLLGMLDSATSFFSSARAHPWLEALICEPDEIPQYKRPPVGSLLYCGAFNRNRTDDLILTMDALYRLSYKGVCECYTCWSG